MSVEISYTIKINKVVEGTVIISKNTRTVPLSEYLKDSKIKEDVSKILEGSPPLDAICEIQQKIKMLVNKDGHTITFNPRT